MLSLKRYRWLCVLGAEAAYFVCLLGGLLPLRTGRGIDLHHALFETLPGFVWISPGSVILGAVYVFVFAWIAGWYIAWMHNRSLTTANSGSHKAADADVTGINVA